MTRQGDLFAAPPVDRWVEGCAGTAAVGLALALGGPRRSRVLLSYQGAKPRHAPRILDLLGLRVGGGVRQLVVNDLGPFGEAWPVLADPRLRGRVVQLVAEVPMGEEGWRELADAPVPAELVERVAAWLALQAGSALSKVVTVEGDRWRTHGYGRLSPSAVRRGFRARLNPPVLAERIASVGTRLEGLDLVAHRLDARKLPVEVVGRTVLYLDPPYRGTTGYRHGLSREGVVGVARAWHAAGAVVVVSEGEPVDLGLGEVAHRVDVVDDERPQAGRRQEWITVARP